MMSNNFNDCKTAAMLWNKIISLQDELRELHLENQRLNKISYNFYKETLDLKKSKRKLSHSINRFEEEIKTLRNQIYILDEIIYNNAVSFMYPISQENEQIKLWKTRAKFYSSELKRLNNKKEE